MTFAFMAACIVTFLFFYEDNKRLWKEYAARYGDAVRHYANHRGLRLPPEMHRMVPL